MNNGCLREIAIAVVAALLIGMAVGWTRAHHDLRIVPVLTTDTPFHLA